MKFVIALVSYLESLGYDTSSLRKSADGSKAIVHMQYAEILSKNLDTNANVTIYDRVNPDFQALLASDEWNGNVTGTPNSFGDLAELTKYEARLTAQVTEAKTDMDNFQTEIAGEVTTAKEDLNAIVDNYQVTVNQQLADTLNKSAITLTHMFADATARDAYFVAHPAEMIELQFIKVGTTYQQYIEGVWTDSVPIVSEQLSATNQPIVDTGNYFTTDNTNAALQELGAHKASTENPHGVTKTQVGLGNADNTSDANKPISTAQQTALNAKANKVQEAWITPTLLNGWEVRSGFPVGYRMDEFGAVHFRGRVSRVGGVATIFMLPSSYRPLVDAVGICIGDGGGGGSAPNLFRIQAELLSGNVYPREYLTGVDIDLSQFAYVRT